MDDEDFGALIEPESVMRARFGLGRLGLSWQVSAFTLAWGEVWPFGFGRVARLSVSVLVGYDGPLSLSMRGPAVRCTGEANSSMSLTVYRKYTCTC